MAGDDKPAKVGEGGKPEAAREGATATVVLTNLAQRAAQWPRRHHSLAGYIYDCFDNRKSGQFVRMTKEISLYVGQESARGGDDLQIAMDTFSLPTILKPPRPDDKANNLDKVKWSGQLKAWQARMTNLEEGMKRLYNTVFAQCSETMVLSLDNYESDILSKSDAIVALLMAIKRISFNFQSQKFELQAICKAMRQLYAYCQGAHVGPQEYLKQFTNNVDVVLTYCGGSIGMSRQLYDMLLTERRITTEALDLMSSDAKSNMRLEA
jgi:hypothetical protein